MALRQSLVSSVDGLLAAARKAEPHTIVVQGHLADLMTVGQVQILARDKVRSGHVEVAGLDVAAADTRSQGDRPQGFGVYAIQAPSRMWNMQADPQVVITADLIGLSAGRASAPVIGSGIRAITH
ncbi:hypothetical protein [Rhodoferax sediminis]|uniref:Uncharacterized protein n=1 Tax=Rhodoferax sediminis TaxID=2509614 RepID=A0A515D6Y7_9BURK|nr:hypothetical protein [Rhodoferax sediminis]QDL36161.1 hypothetical protein EUB48_01755 [Rhodoferax sediminis]